MNISDLTDVVRAASEARGKEVEAILNFQEHVVKEQGTLGQDEFWPELDKFVAIVKKFRDGFKRSNWSEQAADEFFRAAICQDKEAIIRCVRFVATYEAKVAKICKTLNRLEKDGTHELGLGDDGFGDLCDSFLLHGRDAYKRLMEEGVVPKNPALGENYIAMNLTRAAKEWVRNCVAWRT